MWRACVQSSRFKVQGSRFPSFTAATARRLTRRLLAWFRATARDLPWRRTSDPYAVWISEIMLQQTQVKTVVPYWERWMHELPDARALAGAPMERVLKLWEGLGYYARARNLHRAAQMIVAEHGGIFPRGFDDILALPGIGRYSAGAVSSIAFNQPAPILDGNVIRVITRLFGIAGNPRDKKVAEELWQLSGQFVVVASALEDPRRTNCSHLNQALMELGATVCTPAAPACPVCPLMKHCRACRELRQSELPNLGRRTAATAREFHAFVIARRGRLLVRQRPTGVVNAGLWEFPNTEVSPGKAPQTPATAARLARRLGLRLEGVKALGASNHSITRYRIRLHAWSASPSAGFTIPRGTGVWLTLAAADALAFTAAHRKILGQVLNREKEG